MHTLAGPCWTQHTQTPIRRASATLQRPRRRGERRLNVRLEMAPLQPPHEDPWESRHAAVRIAFAPIDMSASRQVLWIGSRQQLRERIESLRIEAVHPSRSPYTTIW